MDDQNKNGINKKDKREQKVMIIEDLLEDEGPTVVAPIEEKDREVDIMTMHDLDQEEDKQYRYRYIN